MDKSKIAIVIADDHRVVRHGLRLLLEAEPDFRVAGEANDGQEAVDLVEQLQPDILVLDIVMPGLNGLEAIRRTVRSSERTRVVILSMHDTEEYVLEALRAGARAYVLKRSAPEELVFAVRQAAAGYYYLTPVVAGTAIKSYVQQSERGLADAYEILSGREREILQLTGEGYTCAEIAARLCISSRTAEAHRASIMRKLGLRNHSDVIRYAIRRGIVSF